MATDIYKRDLLFRLKLDQKYPSEKDLEKLFTHCYTNNQDFLGCPEAELGILPLNFIKKYYDFKQNEIDTLLQPIHYSGGGLVASVKANISSALFIYQKYRLLTAVDTMVTKQMREHYIQSNEPYEEILASLIKYSGSRRRSISKADLEFHFWHFVEDYSLPDKQMAYIRRQAFEKSFLDIQNILKTTDGKVATLKLIIDKFYESIN